MLFVDRIRDIQLMAKLDEWLKFNGCDTAVGGFEMSKNYDNIICVGDLYSPSMQREIASACPNVKTAIYLAVNEPVESKLYVVKKS